MVNMHEIFLSRSEKDSEKALKVINFLEDNKFSVFWDRKNPVGTNFDKFIAKKLAEAKCIVVLWSQNSLNSDYIRAETAIGVERDIYCPILIDEVDPPFPYGKLHAAKLFDWDGKTPTDQIDELLQRVSNLTKSNEPGQMGDQKHVPEEKHETIYNSICMKFKRIPIGKFKMGSETGYDDEKPVHEVTVEMPFYLSIYPVTLYQWKSIMGSNPSPFNCYAMPVVNVSWNDVQEFIKTINKKENTDKYRLPSEAEWEYVARAGKPTQYDFGDDESELNKYAWYAENSGSRAPIRGDDPFYKYDYKDWDRNEWDGIIHPVGKKEPNTWGLYDMYGNIQEWVQDEFQNNYNGAPTDGSARENGGIGKRVLRGGYWKDRSKHCRSADRDYAESDQCREYSGFRLVKDI